MQALASCVVVKTTTSEFLGLEMTCLTNSCLWCKLNFEATTLDTISIEIFAQILAQLQ